MNEVTTEYRRQYERSLGLDRIRKGAKPSVDYARPYKKEVEEDGEFIEVNNFWSVKDDRMQVRKIVFERNENLAHLELVNADERKDTIKVNYNNKKYLLRKTTKAVARALANLCRKLKTAIEHVVGFLETAKGIYYTISRVPREYWTFSRELAGTKIKFTTLRQMGDDDRQELFERVMASIVELNSRRLVMKNPTLESIMFNDEEAVFADPRNLRYSKKSGPMIEQLKAFFSALKEAGIRKTDLFYLLALYAGGAPELCTSWYSEEYGKAPGKDIEVLEALEKKVTGSKL